MQEVYDNFNLMSDYDFKAWLLNTDLLDKEKEFFKVALRWADPDEDDFVHNPYEYYKAIFYKL